MIKWITFLFGGMILMIIAIANTAPELLRFAYDVPGGDKLAHFILTGVMALLLNLTLNNRQLRWGNWSILWGTAGMLVFMTLEEFSQVWLASRDASLLDLLANISGILIIGSLSLLILPLMNQPKPLSNQIVGR